MSSPTIGSFLDNVWKGFQGLGLIVIVIFAWNYFTGPSSKGLQIGSLEGRTRHVLFDIANSSSKQGDVLVWIEKDGIKKCEHVFPMKANQRISNVSVPCRTGAGRFTVKYVWADSDRRRASVAKRIRFNF